MSWRETAGRWASRGDADLSWPERVARWIVGGIGGSIGTSVGGIVIGAIAGNPFTGLVIGVVVGMLLLGVFAVQAIRLAVAGDPQSVNASDDSELADENRKLKAQNEELSTENQQLSAQLATNEELKERCLAHSRELFAFADERDEIDPRNNPNPSLSRWQRNKKETEHDEETREQYSRLFAGRVTADLYSAERRGWISEQERRSLESNVRATIRLQLPTTHIRRMAERLEAFGHSI